MLISAFGVAGIIGGEFAARMKYATASLADEGFVDPDTGIFSPAYIDRVINKCWSTCRRDKKPFSLLFIDVVWPDSIKTAAKEEQHVRIANAIRTNVHLVDDVGCIGSGRFCLVLPYTPVDGAIITNARLEKASLKSHKHHGLTADWHVEILAAPKDERRIEGIHERGIAGQACVGRASNRVDEKPAPALDGFQSWPGLTENENVERDL